MSDGITDAYRDQSLGLEAKTWWPISSAPKNATWVILLVDDRGTRKGLRAHWAEDLSGEEQPPFRGWFEQIGKPGHGFSEVQGEPVGWRADDRQ